MEAGEGDFGPGSAAGTGAQAFPASERPLAAVWAWAAGGFVNASFRVTLAKGWLGLTWEQSLSRLVLRKPRAWPRL